MDVSFVNSSRVSKLEQNNIIKGLTEQITLLHDSLLKIDGMLDTFTMLILSEVNKTQQL